MPQVGFPLQNQPLIGAGGLITQVWLQFFQAIWNSLGESQGNVAIQTGAMIPCGGQAQAGFLACDGSVYLIADYPNLAAYLGTKWNTSAGPGQFNVPDLRGRMPIGADATYTLGSTGGAASVNLTTAQLPAHSHGVNDPQHTHAVTDPTHTHTVTDPTHVHGSVVAASNATAGAAAGGVTAGNTSAASTGISLVAASTGVTNQPASTGITTQNTGSGNPVSTLSPYAAVTWQIKT